MCSGLYTIRRNMLWFCYFYEIWRSNIIYHENYFRPLFDYSYSKPFCPGRYKLSYFFLRATAIDVRAASRHRRRNHYAGQQHYQCWGLGRTASESKGEKPWHFGRQYLWRAGPDGRGAFVKARQDIYPDRY